MAGRQLAQVAVICWPRPGVAIAPTTHTCKRIYDPDDFEVDKNVYCSIASDCFRFYPNERFVEIAVQSGRNPKKLRIFWMTISTMMYQLHFTSLEPT